MLKMNYKRALLAATVLTAFCANAAFANEPPDKPTMRERVNKILNVKTELIATTASSIVATKTANIVAPN